MESKSADLSKIKVPLFVGVGCQDKLIYALTQDGLLYVINENRKTEKWMNIKVNKAIGMRLYGSSVVCCCADGVVWIFETKTL